MICLGECGGFLEKINRRESVSFMKQVLGLQRSPSQVKGERVRTAVHSTKDSRSFPVGVRRFKSDPLH